MHYTSSSAALAVLEYLVHVDPADLPPMELVTYQIPDDEIMVYDGPLPENWRQSPPPHKLTAIGKKWADSQASLALQVPTLLFPDGPEVNVLVNPLHPHAKKLATLKRAAFEFDRRLFKKQA